MTWLAEQSRSLNMQQAVLGCSQLENSIPALASCFPSRRSPDPHRARGGAGPRSKHILAGRGEEGGKAESRLSQQTAPPRAHLPLTVPWHTRGRVGCITTQMGTEGPPACLPASQPGQGREQQGQSSLPWLLKDTQSRSHLLEQWILHGGAADFARRSSDASPTLQLKRQTSDLLHSRVLSTPLPLHFASMAEQWKFSPLSLVNDLQGGWNLRKDLPGSVPNQLLRGAPEIWFRRQ